MKVPYRSAVVPFAQRGHEKRDTECLVCSSMLRSLVNGSIMKLSRSKDEHFPSSFLCLRCTFRLNYTVALFCPFGS